MWMNGKRNLKIVVMGVLFLVLAFVMDRTSDGISDNKLKRNDTGQGDESVELLLNTGDKRSRKYGISLK